MQIIKHGTKIINNWERRQEHMNNEVEQDKELHVASDWGKLELAGEE